MKLEFSTSHLLPVGSRVRLSDMATRSARDLYLSQGKPSVRATYKQHYENERAMRGTVQSIETPTDGRAPFYVVAWDNGTVSQSACYRISAA